MKNWHLEKKILKKKWTSYKIRRLMDWLIDLHRKEFFSSVTHQISENIPQLAQSLVFPVIQQRGQSYTKLLM